MELLIIWLGSIALSIGIDFAQALKMFKDVADQGYKIDVKKLSNIANQSNPATNKMHMVGLFIPIVNIFLKTDQMLKYNQSRPFLLDQLRINDCIEPLSKEEEQDYNSNPTGLKAVLVTIMSDINKDQDIQIITFTDGGEKSSISYREDKNGHRIIIKVEGPASKLSVMEQNAKIDEMFSNLAKKFKEIFTEEEMQDFLTEVLKDKKNNIIDLNAILVKDKPEFIDPITPELTLSEQKEQLEQLREDIIATTEEQLTEEKGQSRTLKPRQ
ncbi:MAG: hypothetical protein PHU45_04340 [Bacilli bacterium]|nr:hypothetical protein [Bacilli bacterium]